MTEAHPVETGNPAAPNLAPQSPEAQLHGHLTGLAGAVLAHYAETNLRDSSTGPNRFTGERQLRNYTYRDGTKRQVATDATRRTRETKIYAPGNILDHHGRRVLLKETVYLDDTHETTYDFVLSPPSDARRTTKSTPNTYRWRENGPVTEVHGLVLAEYEEPLAAGTEEFTEAWKSVAHVDARWLR